MDEIEYMENIDACFPYEDEKAWKATIDEGVAISDNAAYMALYEICTAPSEAAPRDANWVGRAAEAIERRCDEIYRRWKEMPGHTEGDVAFHEPQG